MTVRLAIGGSPCCSTQCVIGIGVWSFAAGAADDAVLAQNAVRNVFKLCHNSDPRVVAPLNEIYLAIHCALPLSEFILRALYMQAFRHLHLIENKLDPWATDAASSAK